MAKLTSQDNELLTRMASIVFADVYRDGPISHLSPARQVFVRIYVVQPIIDNGSLPYFFGSDFPDASEYSVYSEATRRSARTTSRITLMRRLRCFRFPPHI